MSNTKDQVLSVFMLKKDTKDQVLSVFMLKKDMKDQVLSVFMLKKPAPFNPNQICLKSIFKRYAW